MEFFIQALRSENHFDRHWSTGHIPNNGTLLHVKDLCEANDNDFW
jgi:hypothetical protein